MQKGVKTYNCTSRRIRPLFTLHARVDPAMAWLWLPGIETRFNLLLVCSKLARALIVKRASDGTKPSNPPITSSHALVEIPGNVPHMRHPPFEPPPEPPPPEPPGAAWST